MRRFIDANKLIDETRKDRDYAESNGFMDMYFERQVLIERIEKQPTIFDPDEVVKQLGKAAFAQYGNDGMGGEMVVNLDDAIKIVKGDGVDDTCIRAENKESVSQTYLEALIAKYEGYTKLNEEKPLETNSYENGANNTLLAVIADLKEMISRS